MTVVSTLMPSFTQNSNFQDVINVLPAKALCFKHIEDLLEWQVVFIRGQRFGLSAVMCRSFCWVNMVGFVN